jgi:hypothetical protein
MVLFWFSFLRRTTTTITTTTWKHPNSSISRSRSHLAPTMDWFYDMMVPWKHYIPMESDVQDLRTKFEMAQSNPEQSRYISQKASELANFLLSDTYMERIYQDLFVQYLGKLVRGYIPQEFWSTAQETYQAHGYELLTIATCHDWHCTLHPEKDLNITVPI